MQLQTATALVTGANRGIGRALVEALATAGVRRVYAVSRHADISVATAAGAQIVNLHADVTDERTVAALAAQAPDVTLLINNAGVLDFGGVLEAPRAAFERNLETNFYGTLAVARTFAPVIEGKGGGAIVNMLTLVALASMPGLGVYNASKAATWSLTQSLRASLASKRVAVFGVFPGAVDTDMLAGVEMPKTSPADVARAVVRGIADGMEDIFPDPMSTQLYAAWRQDHKAVERQFAAM